MKKILIIDDTAEVLNLIRSALIGAGFETICASNGAEGVAAAKERLPDLVLCDVFMPVLDGYGTLAALRGDPRTAHIPFIFLTGFSDRPHVRQGMELGADDYLTKPFTLEELIGAVNSRLQKHALLAAQSERKLEELRGSIRFALPHELMTPLTCILGFSSMLTETASTITPEQALEYGGHIHAAAMRLQAIIENFLLYSHLEVLAADPKRAASVRNIESIAIGPALDHASRQIIKRYNRHADFICEADGIDLPIAPSHLEKLISELLDNAFKFSAPGTPVTLSASRSGDYFLFSILDLGRGMTTDQIQKVGAHMQFERHIHEQQGSGLGLAIAKRLTQLYGGDLTIESVPNQQTLVRVRFHLRSRFPS